MNEVIFHLLYLETTCMSLFTGKILYVLRLQHGCWYVGSTSNLDRRVYQHRTGQGSEWTKAHPVIDVAEWVYCQYSEQEDEKTRTLMLKYGIHRVRGGHHCQVHFTPEYVHRLMGALSHCCSYCGKYGHCDRSCWQRYHNLTRHY